MAIHQFRYHAYDSYERSETIEELEEKGLSPADALLVMEEINGIGAAFEYVFDDITKKLTLVRIRQA